MQRIYFIFHYYYFCCILIWSVVSFCPIISLFCSHTRRFICELGWFKLCTVPIIAIQPNNNLIKTNKYNFWLVRFEVLLLLLPFLASVCHSLYYIAFYSPNYLFIWKFYKCSIHKWFFYCCWYLCMRHAHSNA